MAVVAREAAERALEIMRDHPAAPEPVIAGTVCAGRAGSVVLKGALGGRRIVDLLSGEQMPRIC